MMHCENQEDPHNTEVLCLDRTVVGTDKKEDDVRSLTGKNMVNWVIDSGATHHMTWARDILINIVPNPRHWYSTFPGLIA